MACFQKMDGTGFLHVFLWVTSVEGNPPKISGKKQGAGDEGNHLERQNIFLVKLARDLIRFPGPLISVAFWEGKSPAISGKSRLVKYYSIWPDIWTTPQEVLFT